MNVRTESSSDNRASVYSTEIPAMPGFYVYRLWAADVCLYIGRTGNSGARAPQRRLRQHRRDKSWWPEVTRMEVAAFPDIPSIIAEERAQITALKPLHNRQDGNCSHDLSLPNAIDLSSGACRICDRDRSRDRQRNLTPAQIAKRREKDRRRQVQHNADKRRRRRAPLRDQGSLR